MGSPIATPALVLPLSVLTLLEEAEVQVPRGLGRWGDRGHGAGQQQEGSTPAPTGRCVKLGPSPASHEVCPLWSGQRLALGLGKRSCRGAKERRA